jgi:hypothetical protein
MTALQNVHAVIPSTCKYATLHGKGELRLLKSNGLDLKRLSWIIQMNPP